MLAAPCPGVGALSLRALLWDVDGTLAETERDGHRVAFNQAFECLGVDRHWNELEYGRLLAVTGGAERLLHDMPNWAAAPSEPGQRLDLARHIQRLKNSFYAELVRGGRIALRPGVREVVSEGRRQNVLQAIVTTTSRTNVDALLSVNLGNDWQKFFAAVVTGEDVERKKPDPQAYLRVLDQLHCEAAQTIAIEDSPAGLASAVAAGIATIVVRSQYFASFDTKAALAEVADFAAVSRLVFPAG
jgi:HAD superfamily hydrolase (TIGR01509 family)